MVGWWGVTVVMKAGVRGWVWNGASGMRLAVGGWGLDSVAPGVKLPRHLAGLDSAPGRAADMARRVHSGGCSTRTTRR
eukprot:7130143-Prymnesium_polylepis.1